MSNKKNILIAEDSIFNQMFIEEFVKLLDQDYSFVNNGKEVLDILQTTKFDIILMDIEMPVMDGIEATKVIRNKLEAPVNEIPIIALTAYKEIYTKEELIDIGINDFILKPFTFEKFNTIVKQYLNPSSEQEEVQEEPTPVEEKSEKLYDLNYINDFSSRDEEFIKEMINYFISNSPSSITKIKECLNDEKWEAISLEIQRLRPSLVFLGIECFNEDIQNLETYVSTRTNLEKLPEIIDRIEEKNNSIVQSLKNDYNIN